MTSTTPQPFALGVPRASYREWSARWRVRLLVGLVVAIPFVVLAVRIVHSHWLASADSASMEIRTRDVGTVHSPLVGPYSRFGWNHPGPLLFYALAPSYRLLGSNATGLLFGAVLINLAAVACIGVVLWRHGRWGALLVGLTLVLLLARAMGAAFLMDPWNPYVIVLPMFAVVLLAWAAIDGDGWALPVAVAVGSFTAQTHVGAALGAAVPIAVAAVVLWRSWRTLLVAFVAGVVAWSPPLVQEFQPHGGNLSTLVRYWTQSQPHTVGWTRAARIVGVQLAIPAPWLTGHIPLVPFTGGVDGHRAFPLALLFLAGSLAVAIRRRDRQALWLDVIALAMVFAGVVAAAHVVGTPYDYVIRWLWIIGPVVWLAILWTLARALHKVRPAVVALTGVAAILVVALTVWNTSSAQRAAFPDSQDEQALRALAPAARNLRRLPGPLLVTEPADLHSANLASGILALALHDGVDARAASASGFVFGAWHTVDRKRAGTIVIVAVENLITQYRNDPRYRLLASHDPLIPAQRAERDAIDQQEQHAYLAGLANIQQWFATHPHETAIANAYDRRGPRVALFQQLR